MPDILTDTQTLLHYIYSLQQGIYFGKAPPQRNFERPQALVFPKLIDVGPKTEVIRAFIAPQDVPASLFLELRQKVNDTRFHIIQYTVLLPFLF